MKEIKVCKNPECTNEFLTKHKNHYYCCDVCKYTHRNNTEIQRKRMNVYNRSDKEKARAKRYLQTEKGRRYNSAKAARQRSRYPERCNARIVAVKNLPKGLPCSMDGCENPGERHHPDYTKPLEVVYLCKQHHVGHHGSYRLRDAALAGNL